MGRSLIDRIQAKLEFFRLEQHYTRRRHRRSTFVSNAVYVDGEYVYQTPNSTGSSTDSGFTRIDALHGEQVGSPKSNNMVGDMPSPMMDMDDEPVAPMPERKRLNRFSSMPSFNGSTTTSSSVSERRRSAVQWFDKKW
ncbi:hypothetical protein NLG97_g8617 [Lecanicillium saksenae]|uniref:Uncharacterized protein n=1 Tax=Lecanicillium saksenae TaxID=468837 RepID=A0ACC1QJK9_9HYPO|nr:hypothetical protein NLG97_g8617 [Lecanicillium saksenae]